MTPFRVLIVDDHPIVRLGLTRLLSEEADITVCGEAGDAPSALEAVARHEPQAAIVDISLSGTSGLDLVRTIKRERPELVVLVVSMHDEALYAERALRAGASGYVMKQEAMEVIIKALRRVLSGEIFLSDAMSGKLLRRFAQGSAAVDHREGSPLASLSDREFEVLRLIGQGFGTREIAEILRISIKTVESHRAHLKEKIKLSSGTELARYAALWVEGAVEGGEGRE
jgi:DNA-binding NarL/FixJ family response regulator